jgi:hypothetical protein
MLARPGRRDCVPVDILAPVHRVGIDDIGDTLITAEFAQLVFRAIVIELEALEGFRKLRHDPVRIIRFIHADGSELQATIAKGPHGFVCRRGPGEELDAFRARASAECRATRGPVILIMDQEKEPSDAARS